MRKALIIAAVCAAAATGLWTSSSSLAQGLVFPPRGPAKPASIILYDGANYQGRSVELRADIDRLQYERFDNLASSVKLKGGQWQLCPDEQFRGKCTIISKDVPDLAAYKLSDQLSSFRRLE